MTKLVLIRHGESLYNKEKRFAGWTDTDLSPEGIEQAKRAGHMLKERGYTFDEAHTSMLKRTIRTLWIILDVMDLMWIPVRHSWRLNERHQGALQGMKRDVVAEKFGHQVMHRFHSDHDFKPPALNEDDRRYSGCDPRYQSLGKEVIPLSESMKDATGRFLPYWFEVIVPAIKSGKQVLIVSHGYILRSLVKYLDGDSNAESITVPVATNAAPLVYEFGENLTVRQHYYLTGPK